MSINISEVIWTIICFFALLFVLKTFLFGPLIRFMDERRSRIDAGLDEGRQAEDARQEAARAAEESWARRGAEARDLLTQSKLEDDRFRAETLEAAHERAAKEGEAAEERIAREESEAREAARLKSGELTRTLARRLLDDREEG